MKHSKHLNGNIIMTKHQPSRCDTCDECFAERHILKRHLLAHNEKQSSNNKKTTKLHSLTKRTGTRFVVSSYNNADDNCSTSKRCMFCDKIFLKNSDLERHIRTHTNERAFKCSKCNKSFKLKNTLERHFKTHDKVIFTCVVCMSNYDSNKVLQNHIRRLHSSRQTYYVSYNNPQSAVNDEFVGTNLKADEVNQEITDSKLTSFSDLLCDTLDDTRESSSPHNSKTIEINHVEIGNEEIVRATDKVKEVSKAIVEVQERQPGRKQFCDACGKGFKKPIDLKRHHDAVHDKKRPFVCQACGKSFSLKCTLTRHTEIHDSEERKFVSCGICLKMFSSKSSLNLHQRLHKNLKPFKCQQCTSAFRTSGHLKSHLKTHSRKSIVANFNSTLMVP